MLNLLKTVWRKWKGLAHGIVHAQTWVLMGFIYWFTVGPVSFMYKLFNPDPIDRKLGDPDASSYAKPVETEIQDIRQAQRPW